ncbi:UNVERIFIED_CONTAM: hypothetical protein FKN15_005938 [Acipenser sinensis]
MLPCAVLIKEVLGLKGNRELVPAQFVPLLPPFLFDAVLLHSFRAVLGSVVPPIRVLISLKTCLSLDLMKLFFRM